VGGGRGREPCSTLPDALSWLSVAILQPSQQASRPSRLALLPRPSRPLPPPLLPQEHSAAFAVSGGTTLELTLAQYWSSLGEAALSVELAFHGVQVVPSKVSGRSAAESRQQGWGGEGGGVQGGGGLH
jgi:hypothetical protein